MPSVVEKYTDYLDVIDKSIDSYSSKKKTQKQLAEKYKDTPVEEIPEEALIVLFSDTPVDSIPEQIRPRVVNAAVALEAKRLGPVPEDEQSKFAEQVQSREPLTGGRFIPGMANYYGVPGLVPYTKTSKAQRIGIEEGITDSARTIAQAASNLVGSQANFKKDFSEEFRNRVEIAREGAMTDYITGLAAGGTLDPVTGGVTTAATGAGGMMLKNAPLLGVLLGGTAAGASTGALIPTYPEFGDSRLKNTGVGAAIGGGITAIPVGGAKAAQAIARLAPKQTPVVPPKLAPQPVPMTLSGGRVQPKQTPVTTATIDIEPQVTQSTPSTLKLQNIDLQIADLKAKAVTVGRKKRKPIESQIKKLEQAKTNELNRANKKSKEVDEQVVQLENQISRLAARSAELQPGQAGAKARIQRAQRRTQELETEVDTLTGLDFAPNGGYRVNVNGQLYDNPRQLVAIKNRIDLHNTTGAEVEFILPPPKPTGDPVTDAANKINYIQLSSDSGPRLGLDAPPALSSAGVRPAVQYADEAAMGVDEAQAIKAGTMAESTARKRAEDPRGVDVGRDELMTAEEKGRRAGITESTEQRRQLNLAAKAVGGDEEDALWAYENLPTIDKFSFENLEESARLLKQEGFIAREYDTLLDMLMEKKGDILSAEVMQALRPLFLEAENRVDQIIKQMRKLKKEGLADSEEMVDLVQDLYLNTYIADLRRTNGTAASHILTQAKMTKRFTAENTRRVNEGKLITNLFGVDCG